MAKHLGLRLRALRRAHDLTQAALAERAGLTERTIRQLVSGGGNIASLRAALSVLGQELRADLADEPRRIRTLLRRTSAKVQPARHPDPTWYTPHILAALYSVFGTFDLDPCSPDPPTVRCRHFYTEAHDGLAQSWQGTVYCNPPYDAVPAWIAKAMAEHRSGRATKVVALVPYLPHTSGWRTLVRSGAVILVLEDRLKFGGRRHLAPSCSAVVVWGAPRAELDALAGALPPSHRVVTRQEATRQALGRHLSGLHGL